MLVQEILKLKIVPVQFANKYPVPTNIILSVVAAITVAHAHLVWAWSQIGNDAGQVGTIAVVAAIAYNMLLSHWTELRAMEG